MLAYFDACSALAHSIHRAFARDLGLPLDFFVDKLDRPMATLRLLHYPATPPGEIGAGEHTDYGNITLLATDDVGGLEVRTRSGDWIVAPPMPGAFVVNIGDCLMRWTNDVYVSTPHRVVNRSGRERYSIAFFFDPNPEARVGGDSQLHRARRSGALRADPGGGLSQDAAGREHTGGAVRGGGRGSAEPEDQASASSVMAGTRPPMTELVMAESAPDRPLRTSSTPSASAPRLPRSPPPRRSCPSTGRA